MSFDDSNFFENKRPLVISKLNYSKEAFLGQPKKESKSRAAEFENEVFDFLFRNKKGLSIQKIYRLTNSIIDGFVITEKGKPISLEIKLVLNWPKSAVARTQLQRFNIEKVYEKLELPAPQHGLIIFKDFTSDWSKIRAGRALEDGWYRFYEEQRSFDKIINMNIDICRLDDELRNPLVKK